MSVVGVTVRVAMAIVVVMIMAMVMVMVMVMSVVGVTVVVRVVCGRRIDVVPQATRTYPDVAVLMPIAVLVQ